MFIPGRIEVIGKHTDYCGGRSIVCAIDRGLTTSISPNGSSELTLFNTQTRESGRIHLSSGQVIDGPRWMLYPNAVVRALTELFPKIEFEGLEIEFSSDLPRSSGLSSSSAFVIAVFKAMAQVNGLEENGDFRDLVADRYELSSLLGGIESGSIFNKDGNRFGVGTKGGSQDHVAIICSEKGKLNCFSYVPTALTDRIPFPEDLVFVVGVSGVPANKTGKAKGKYNRLSEMVSEFVEQWPGDEQTLREIIEGPGIDEAERFLATRTFSFSSQDMIDRIRHFYAENFGLIGEVLRLMKAGDFEHIGGLLDISQRNAERYLYNQTPETIFLQRSARQIGCFASSAFGAGFGGSVYALIEKDAADEFIKEWKGLYAKEFPNVMKNSEFFVTSPSEISI